MAPSLRILSAAMEQDSLWSKHFWQFFSWLHQVPLMKSSASKPGQGRLRYHLGYGNRYYMKQCQCWILLWGMTSQSGAVIVNRGSAFHGFVEEGYEKDKRLEAKAEVQMLNANKIKSWSMTNLMPALTCTWDIHLQVAQGEVVILPSPDALPFPFDLLIARARSYCSFTIACIDDSYILP